MADLANMAPWLAVAASGALHGLNPASGWACAAWAGRHGDPSSARRTLRAVAAGHGASLLLVALAVPASLQFGRLFDPLLAQGIAAALLLALAFGAWRRGAGSGRTGVALWSFIVGLSHGAGWLLVPALVPLCASGMPGAEIAAAGSLVLGLAAAALHLASLLAVTSLATACARRGWQAWARRTPCAH